MLNLKEIKRIVEEAFQECFCGGAPKVRIVNKSVVVEHKDEDGDKHKWMIYEGEIAVKRYRDEKRRRQPYWDTTTGLLVTKVFPCYFIGGGRLRQEEYTLFKSVSYDIGCAIGHLLESWATFRIRNYAFQPRQLKGKA